MNSSATPPPALAPTLDNCADEPIHLPGSIQPHGAMLVFDRAGLLLSWSANAAAMLELAVPLSPGLDPPALGLAPEVRALLAEVHTDIDADLALPTAIETAIGARQFDCIAHAHQGRVVVEFESRAVASDAVAAFALKAHGAIDRLKRQQSVGALLQMATDQVRAITGFDRVMAYHFRQDDSGDVLAEARRDDLEAYLGRRYPASDIPAQARRLYLVNTLRLIADVGYRPVPVLGRAGDAALDMSHCVLRSVSPIHIEYLQNMGVGASMSISIVVNGRLWGLIACHHMGPRQVPYSIRMACDVMAQVLAATVQSLEAREGAALVEQAAQMRTRLIETLLHDDDVLKAFEVHAGEIRASLRADALVVGHHGRHYVHGEIDAGAVEALLRSLGADGPELVRREALDQWPPADQAALGKWVGMLALRFDPGAGGWLAALRAEQIESVRWAGQPEKPFRQGPLGPRLTPRGSFDEWRQTVRGRAEPWTPTQRLIADQLLAEMHRASNARHVETERARTQLLAMLGHDLRNPLQSIDMAASVLEHGGSQQTASRRIRASSGRMQRLISQVLDMSRIDHGLRLGGSQAPVDLVPLLSDLLDEMRVAYPGLLIDAALPARLTAPADADRLGQVFTNLLSNARHHGTPGLPITVRLERRGAHAVVEVRNVGPAIADDVAETLYNPFKRTALANNRNRGGMGLGLYIARRIMDEHGGAIAYTHEAPHVLFTITLPARDDGVDDNAAPA